MLEIDAADAAAALTGPGSPMGVPDHVISGQSPQIIVTGPHGMGHSATLSRVGARLRAQLHGVEHIDCRAVRSEDRLKAVPEDRAVLLHQGEFASVALLTLIAMRIRSAQAPLILAWDDSDFSSGANERIELLREQDYELADAFQRLRPVILAPWDDRSIEALIHRHFSRHPDTLTVGAVRILSAGRPLWALELVQLATDGLVHSRPRPAISRLDPVRWNTSTMREIRDCVGEISETDAAAGLAICSLESIAWVSAEQVFGASVLEALVYRKLLVVVNDARGLLAPVVMLIEPLRQRTSTRAVSLAEDRLAAHLLAMAELGVSLSEAELRFCAAQIAVATSPGAEFPELLRVSTETRGKVLLRAASLAADFGRHDTARSFQVAATRLGATRDPIELVRAIAGRDDPRIALSRMRDDDFADADVHAITYLSGLFRTEAGISGVESVDDESFLLDVWNRQDRLDGSLARVLRIAHGDHTDPRLRLLAGALLLLASAASGLLPDPQVAAQARANSEDLARPGVPQTALTRDAQSTYLLTLAISELLSTGRVRAQSFGEETARIAWSDSNLTWLGLLETATLALASGDVVRAGIEWKLLLEYMPRFAATRVTQAFRSMQSLIAAGGIGGQDPTLSNGYIGLVVAHWAGDLSTASALLQPTPSDTARIAPLAQAIREVILGNQSQNPTQLMRAAESLLALEQWASALAALEIARKILVRRRSSGAIVVCNALVETVLAAAQDAVPWALNLASPNPTDFGRGLTARELEIAGLASQGCSNKEIAASLRLSVRTVESHLAQARAKLGVATRSQLAEHLRSA